MRRIIRRSAGNNLLLSSRLWDLRQSRHSSSARPARTGCVSAGVFASMSAHQQDQAHSFVDFLLEENLKYNLTSVRDREEAFRRHVLDSLALLEVIEDNISDEAQKDLSVIDIGSGPGLPGCILAIARPSWTVCCPCTVGPDRLAPTPCVQAPCMVTLMSSALN